MSSPQSDRPAQPGASPTAPVADSGRLKIVTPILTDFAQWRGGLNYIVNLLHILRELPADEAPEVVVFDDAAGAWPEYVVAACAAFPVAATVGPRGVIVNAPDPAMRARLEETPPEERRRRLAGRADAIFPMPGADARTAPTPRHWAWIPDFQHRRLPELFSAEELTARDAAFAGAAERDGPLLLSSEDARRDFQTFHPNARCTPHVWRFASSLSGDAGAAPADVRARYGLPERYLYIPNQFWVHKDHRTAFRALGLSAERGVDIDIVCTGQAVDHRDEGHYRRLFEEAAEIGVDGRIRHLGLVPPEDQIGLLRGCVAVLQPSRFEGWSTVIEDARAIGARVIASDIGVHREQLGDEAVYFAVGDAEDLAAVLERTLPGLTAGVEPARAAEAVARAAQRRLECARALMRILRADIAARRAANDPNHATPRPAP